MSALSPQKQSFRGETSDMQSISPLANASVHNTQNEYDDGDGHIDILCNSAEPLGQRLFAAGS